MIDIKPKVIQDFDAIKEKFPCVEFELVSYFSLRTINEKNIEFQIM